MPGGKINHMGWEDNRGLAAGFHGHAVGIFPSSTIRYRPGGYWLILDVTGPWYEINPGHIKFKRATVLKRYRYFHTLLKDPRMADQKPYFYGPGEEKKLDYYIVGDYMINETGPCEGSTPAASLVYGRTQAKGYSYLASGIGGKLVSVGRSGNTYKAQIGVTRDASGKVMKPYVWYKHGCVGWRN